MAEQERITRDSVLTEEDLRRFAAGSHSRLYEVFGAHLCVEDGVAGVRFAVWAPNAEQVSVIGEFNGWDIASHPLRTDNEAGVWEGFIPGVSRGELYKYHVVGQGGAYRADKADPFALLSETPPGTASLVWNLDYAWGDQPWMRSRRTRTALDAPITIYEVHLGSWMRVPEEGHRPLTYRELAPRLADYVEQIGFTHVELLPVMEHPFYGSWGYQITGYFAPTSRYGTPQDFMFLIDHLHQRGIGVILDWVPSHFPTDGHGLAYFDGMQLYEHPDRRRGFHPDWNSMIFNYGRDEVCAFLISSALFWLDCYHIDSLRVDAVASMIYLDFSRNPGEWVPNQQGGRENLEAITFLRRLNQAVYTYYPDIQTIAEDSSDYPLVSRPVDAGGLGFGLKWDMGWMHDTLEYLAHPPHQRREYHSRLTFRGMYAFNENYVLPLSHDEVVYGKRALLNKMPGDDWQQFANLRLLLGYMYGLPGKKLLFMGDEFGQRREWNHDMSLDWHLLQEASHAGVQRWIADLNWLYRDEPALHELDCDPAGFVWISADDARNSVISFLRTGRSADVKLLIVCNFTPVPCYNYRVGVPHAGFWSELLNSDATFYGGSGQGNMSGVAATPIRWHSQPFALNLTLPPLAALFFRHVGS